MLDCKYIIESKLNDKIKNILVFRILFIFIHKYQYYILI